MLDRGTSADPNDARRVLLVLTRDPRGRVSGRKLVLRTILESMIALGHDVTVAFFGEESAGDEYREAKFVPLQGPTRFELLRGALGWLTPLARPLNEVLYRSRRAARTIDDLAASDGAQVIVTDMIRTAAYAEHRSLPWIADLDDLLSERYRRLAEEGLFSSDLLGYHRSIVLRLAANVLKPFGSAVLRREARLIEKREIEIAKAAERSTLVSATEASALTARSGRAVNWTPMSVHGPTTAPTAVAAPEPGLIFLGGLDYRANLKSVADFDSTTLPALEAEGLTEVELHVIGHSEASHLARLSSSVVLHGYVEDLPSELRKREAMLVPEVDPGGIKTKIIQAAFHGVIILAHESAVRGTGLTAGKEVIVWSNARELADAIRALRTGEIDRESLVKNAFEFADATFGFPHIRDLWAAHIDKATQVGTVERKCKTSVRTL